MPRLAILAVILCSAALIIGLLALSPSTSDVDVALQAPRAAGSADASAAALAPRWGCRLEQGERFAADGVENVDVTVNYIKIGRAFPMLRDRLPKGIHKAEVRAAWHLELIALEPVGDRATLRGQWWVRPDASSPELGREAGDLRVGVSLLIGPDCRVSDVRVQRGVPPAFAARAMQSLHSLSFVYPAKGEAKATNEQAVESAVVRYTYVQLSPDGRQLRGRFRGLIHSFLAKESPGAAVQAMPRVGVKTIDASDERWFTSISGRREARSEHDGAQSVAQLHVRAVVPDLSWTLPPFELSGLDMATLTGDLDDAAIYAEIDKYKKKSLDDMFAMMDEWEASGRPVREQVTALTYWLLGHPDEIPAYVERLRRGGFGSARRNAHATSALAQTQLPEAERAIRSLFNDDHTDAQVRGQAIVSMSLEIQDPTHEGVNELIALAGTPSDYPGAEHMASLGMGAMAHRIEDRHPEVREQIVAELGKRLESDHGDGLFNALKGAGNAGAPELLPKIKAHLRSPEPEPKAAAWSALKSQPAATLSEHFEALAGQATRIDDRAALFEAVAASIERSGDEPSAAILQAALAMFAANDYAHTGTSLDAALMTIIGNAYRHDPGNAGLLAALRQKFAAAAAAKDAPLMQQIVTLVGIAKLKNT